MDNSYRDRCRPCWRISAEVKSLDALELIREALDCRLRLRQAVQQLEEAFGYIQSSTYEKLESLSQLFADTEELDEAAMASILDGIRRKGDPDPAPQGRLLGL